MRLPSSSGLQSFRSSPYPSTSWRDPAVSYRRREAALALNQGLQRRERFLSFSLRSPVATAWGRYVIDHSELHKIWRELTKILGVEEEVYADVRKMINSKEDTDKVEHVKAPLLFYDSWR